MRLSSCTRRRICAIVRDVSAWRGPCDSLPKFNFNFNAHGVDSATVNKATGVVCDRTVALVGHDGARDYPEHLRRVRFNSKPQDREDVGVFDEQRDATHTGYRPALQELLAGEVILQMKQAAFANQEASGHRRESGEDADLVRRRRLCAEHHRQKKLHLDASLCHNGRIAPPIPEPR
jgi:hypothetical protein